MATILIVGASKGVGLEAVKAGLATGLTVRAMARTASSIAIDDPRLEKINGSALSKADTATALTGVDAVIQTIGISDFHSLIFGTTLFSSATRVLVESMTASGTKRLIALTGAGTGNSRGRINPLYDYVMFPIMLQRVYNDKDIAEQIIMASALDWTIARPGLLTSGAKTGHYKALPDMNDWRGGFISRADVADFLIKQVTDRTMIGQTPLLVN